jgi:serine/threonine protein kinase
MVSLIRRTKSGSDPTLHEQLPLEFAMLSNLNGGLFGLLFQRSTMKLPFSSLFASASKSRFQTAHMTFARSGIGQSVSRTGDFLKRQLWVWPILAFVSLSIIGFFVRSAIESTIRANVKSGLETLLHVETAMLENWYAVQVAHVQSIAKTSAIRQYSLRLINASMESSSIASKVSETALDVPQIQASLQREIAPFLESHDSEGYFICDRNRKILAASNDELIGMKEVQQFESFLSRAFEGEPVVSKPIESVTRFRGDDGIYRTGVPVMYAAAPLLDENLQIVGALALRIFPEKEFCRILSLGQIGKSGETYAFDRNGLMLSNSRFERELILLGILPDVSNSRSILQLLVRDPGGDMTQGFRPTKRRVDMPMTRMIASATSGNTDSDVTGYNGYRGQLNVGAWTWLEKYNVGVAAEMEHAEAFRPLTILSRVFWGLFSLLVAASLAIFVFTLILSRMQHKARKAAIEAQELGQYKLEKELGKGAMGVVYKGYHAMMRRPTAIKLLNVESMNETAIARFEHEVQITSQLNHPNTIAIYDYGRTPEGLFYYAMEYLDGIDLQSLVDQYGPQPESRVIQILLQICGSLYEAHAQGLVHRDIKPANIMLNRRGGEPDVIKVLDFGLVKQVDSNAKGMSGEGGLAGTPLYLSPEAIQSPSLVDACSDLYAVGAVGYYLITGKTVFEANSIIDLLQKHVTEPAIPPSRRVHIQITREFEDALLSCLEKSRAKRPQTARDLALLLRRCKPDQPWTIQDAESWWSNHERRLAATGASPATSHSSPLVHAPMERASTTDSNPSAASKTPADRTETGFDQTIVHPPKAPD